jgi:epoxyqueuosine reductase
VQQQTPENDGPPPDPQALAQEIRELGRAQGFQAIGIAGIELAADEARLERWLALGRHGEMAWMARHGQRRSRPAELVAGTVSVISARMDYWPGDAEEAWQLLGDGRRGYVSRYALGRDYHKVLRRRLQRLADAIAARIGPFGYRVFVDSAPVLEKALARDAGLGWIGKHTNLIDRDGGSYFFLGEIYTDLALPHDRPASDHCGSCRACIDACPTGAIVGPWELDARRCISYLTIEHPGSIPESFREAIGNRIYGCDDCQLVCPWNKFARTTGEADFTPRAQLDGATLVEFLSWGEEEWLRRTEGSAIRRIGHVRWLRNVAIAMGNAPADERILAALRSRLDHPEPVVVEHVRWALARQTAACARTAGGVRPPAAG